MMKLNGLKRYVFLAALALSCAGTTVWAEETKPDGAETFTLGLAGRAKADNGGLYGGGELFFLVEAPAITATADLDFVNDGKWLPTEGWMKNGLYFNLKESWVKVNLERFKIDGGFLKPTHRLSENPYEILIDGSGKGSVGMSFAYDGSLVIYESRWIGLNYLSPFTYGYGNVISAGGSADRKWLDRGFNHKLYALKFGQLRVGYQESSVFLNRYFDANFFLNPAPSILVNTLWSQGNNPWVYETNDSSMMGFYADYDGGAWRAEAEFIIKDFNASFGYPTNLNKFAWSAGGSWKSPIGTVAFWHGGATKHMFAASYQRGENPNVYPYEYTYYPLDIVAGRTISLQDNYIGFPFGENSLAFRLTWNGKIEPITGLAIDADCGLEWVLSGSKSPHNPWHEAKDCAELLPGVTDFRTEFLNGEAALEHRLSLLGNVGGAYDGWFARFDFRIGVALNPLGLTFAGLPSSEPPLWKPVAGAIANLSVVDLTLGYKVRL